ncbi:amidohydrolase family protein, partial [Bacillus thuringiensis]|nr:amidohydrolase family protein [Bacillus thuringiensis]
PPIYRMLDLGIPVGAGSDATRVSSYNHWVALYWMVAGKTIGGLSIYDEKNKLDRKVALELYSKGSAWFSGDEGKKGTLAVGHFADI